MQYARDHGLAGPVYASNNIGGFVEWSLYPSARVFQDSRLQAYPREHFQRMLEDVAIAVRVGVDGVGR